MPTSTLGRCSRAVTPVLGTALLALAIAACGDDDEPKRQFFAIAFLDVPDSVEGTPRPDDPYAGFIVSLRAVLSGAAVQFTVEAGPPPTVPYSGYLREDLIGAEQLATGHIGLEVRGPDREEPIAMLPLAIESPEPTDFSSYRVAGSIGETDLPEGLDLAQVVDALVAGRASVVSLDEAGVLRSARVRPCDGCLPPRWP